MRNEAEVRANKRGRKRNTSSLFAMQSCGCATLLYYIQAETKGQSRASKGEGEKRREEDEWTDNSDTDEQRLSSHDFTYFLKGTRVASHKVACS